MNAKEFLQSVRDEQKEIEELERRIAEAETSLLPEAIRYDRDKVQTSPTDTMSETIAKVADYTEDMKRHRAILADRRLKAQKMINQLESSNERTALCLYYLSDQRISMEQVGDAMHYSRRQVCNICKKGLKNLDNLFTEFHNA